MALNNVLMFLALTGIYEPSAIQQLPDGRFLIVEDEKQHPFSLVTINADGRIGSTPLNPEPLEAGESFGKLDDLEGIALDRAGYLYAITSHSRDGDGDEKKSRDKLVRFRIEGGRVVAPRVTGGLKPVLIAAHPVMAAAAGIRDPTFPPWTATGSSAVRSPARWCNFGSGSGAVAVAIRHAMSPFPACRDSSMPKESAPP